MAFYISTTNGRIHYIKRGNGPKTLVALHGYGESAAHFDFLWKEGWEEFTIYAIDLPYHGESQWTDSALLKPQDLMQAILQMTNVQADMHLLAYSMGGRIALHLLQTYPQHFAKAVLLAPDGLHNNFWQRLATRSAIGNLLFKCTMQYPFWLFGLMQIAVKTKLLNESIYKFAYHYLGKKEQRLLLYQRWTCFKNFKVNKPLLQKGIEAHTIQLHLVFGKYDRIILPKHAQSLANQFINIHIWEAGHLLLKPVYSKDIMLLVGEA